MIYLYIFIGGGLVGWALDTAYRTWTEKHYTSGTWLPYFSLIYGVNAVFLYTFFHFFSISFYLDIVIGSVISVCVEIVSGLMGLVVLKKRLWDYRNSRFNIIGFVDLEHTFYWMILVSVCRILYSIFFIL